MGSLRACLCGTCLGRLPHGLEPPWWPNHRQRHELQIVILFHVHCAATPYELQVSVCGIIIVIALHQKEENARQGGGPHWGPLEASDWKVKVEREN